MTWGSPPESAICGEKVLLSMGGCLCCPPCPLVPARGMPLLGPHCSPHLSPAPWPGQASNGEMGTPCNPGAEGNGALSWAGGTAQLPPATRLPSGRWCWWDPTWSYTPPAGERDDISTLGCPEPGRSCPRVLPLAHGTPAGTSHPSQAEIGC